jgi:hypothetical protein
VKLGIPQNQSNERAYRAEREQHQEPTDIRKGEQRNKQGAE